MLLVQRLSDIEHLLCPHPPAPRGVLLQGPQVERQRRVFADVALVDFAHHGRLTGQLLRQRAGRLFIETAALVVTVRFTGLPLRLERLGIALGSAPTAPSTGPA